MYFASASLCPPPIPSFKRCICVVIFTLVVGACGSRLPPQAESPRTAGSMVVGSEGGSSADESQFERSELHENNYGDGVEEEVSTISI